MTKLKNRKLKVNDYVKIIKLVGSETEYVRKTVGRIGKIIKIEMSELPSGLPYRVQVLGWHDEGVQYYHDELEYVSEKDVLAHLI